MTSSKHDAGVSESEPRPTTPEVAGMIWQEEVQRKARRREWVAFYTGCVFTSLFFLLIAVFVTRLTGGVEVCP